ncbi:MAG TPA: isocitrate lyase/phosphoenolpyruvate mutase family protein [Acidimicrobiales bacterium]
MAAEPVLMPGVWDPLSAKAAAAAGFEVLFLSGYALAGTLLGLPDVGYLTQTEVADAARRVCAAVPGTAVVVDGDTGYGGVLNVVRTVELWEAAGAAGVFLEDQVFPKRCGHMAGKQVVPRGEWMAKLLAALDRREHLFVCARTDARAAEGLHEALERGRAAADLGVDAVFVEAPESVEELESIAEALTPTGVTLVANMVESGHTPLLTIDELADLGFSLVVSPLSGLLAATAALQDAFGHLRKAGSMQDRLDGLLTFDEFTDLVELDRHRALDPDRPDESPAG